ncbi:MAG: hypothetical protein JWR19_38 [Pedosphaera sp.]|nr:hypothetical protein [Pedosphaera sp.]
MLIEWVGATETGKPEEIKGATTRTTTRTMGRRSVRPLPSECFRTGHRGSGWVLDVIILRMLLMLLVGFWIEAE